MLGNLIEDETWERLPVPENLKVREIEEGYPLLDHYPSKTLFERSLSLFRNQNDATTSQLDKHPL